MDLKAMLRSALDWLAHLAASRAVGAVTLTAVIAFGCHFTFFPDRLPPLSGFSLADLGLLPTDVAAPVDAATLVEARKQAREAAQAGLPYVQEWLAANPEAIRWLNLAGLTLATLAFFGSLTLRDMRKATAGPEMLRSAA